MAITSMWEIHGQARKTFGFQIAQMKILLPNPFTTASIKQIPPQ
jgi:hypothetical protein